MALPERMRQILRRLRRGRDPEDRARKLAAIRVAVGHAFPTADIDEMLVEIGRGYLGR